MKEAVASFVVTKKRMPDGRIYESPRIYLPTKLTTDSSFPFARGALRLYVRVSGKRLLVERAAPTVLKRFSRGRRVRPTAKAKPKERSRARRNAGGKRRRVAVRRAK